MNNDAGWNGSGGPWIKPEQSMQKVVWTETNLAGPRHFEGSLTQPEIVAGFYRDITVLAFPAVGAYRIEGIRQKAAFEVGGVGEPAAKTLPAEMVIDRSRVLDLGSRMVATGVCSGMCLRESGRCCAWATRARGRKTRRHRRRAGDWNATS